MKSAALLLCLLSFSVMVAAQAVPHSNYAPPSGAQASATASQNPSTPASSDLRGCLSGSKGNYTLIDHWGKSHKVTGDNHALWEEVGHEVDMSGKMEAANTFQETGITDIAARCWNFGLK